MLMVNGFKVFLNNIWLLRLKSTKTPDELRMGAEHYLCKKFRIKSRE